jgi:SAM-dependent methyltransferase
LRCNLCGSERITEIVSINGYQILRCLECSLTQADVPEDKVEDIYKPDGYFTDKSTGTTFGMETLAHRTLYNEIPLNERTFDLFNAFGKQAKGKGLQPKSVLEIGPSPNGGTIRYLTALPDVEGLEISEYATAHLRKLGFSMHCGSISNVQIGKKYDIILAYEVVEHLREPKASFLNIFNHLEAGGVFIFSTGNAKSLKARIRRKNWEYFLPPQHLFYFDGDTIVRYLEGAGFAKRNIRVNRYSLWSKKKAIELGFPGATSRAFLKLINNLTSGMTVYATK